MTFWSNLLSARLRYDSYARGMLLSCFARLGVFARHVFSSGFARLGAAPLTCFLGCENKLAQVQALLAAKPGDPQLAKLYQDLTNVVNITENIRKAREAGASGGVLGEGAPSPPAGVAAAPTSSSVGQKIDGVSPAVTIEVGSRVEAMWTDGKWYSARVDSVDEAKGTVTCTYLVYGNVGEVKKANIRAYRPISSALCRVGASVRAFWETDGLFYPATIEGTAPEGTYRVRFKQYKYMATLSVFDILPDVSHGRGKDSALEAKLVIPENLKILPSDSEKQKEIKKKKVKALKKKHRKRKLEQETDRRKSSWQSFLNGKRKRFKGLKKKKKSMFASPDTVDGRVGVVGSGRDMTTFKDRKRHKFERGSQGSTQPVSAERGSTAPRPTGQLMAAGYPKPSEPRKSRWGSK